MTTPDPGRVLRRALIAWGWGHLSIGRTALGACLVIAEVIAIPVLGWLTIGLADSSAYLMPFLAGVGFLVVWGAQAVHAYRAASAARPAGLPRPERSPATAIGWLSLPLLAWGAGFWLIGAHAATPAATLDRFVSAWTAGELESGTWPVAVLGAADEAAVLLGSGPDRFRDVRFSIVGERDGRALAVGDAIHYERRDIRLLGVIPGSELVPVADQRLLTLELATQAAVLPGGVELGAVRWELVGAGN